jgi:His/Glu/Gln/Arg/opine family amino acid ABC transporter permease subunit
MRIRLSTGTALLLVVIAAIAVAVATGNLGFLRNATSWQLGFSVIAQSPADPYWLTMGAAVLNTVVLAAISICVATVVGAAVAFIAIAGNPAWSRIAAAYVQFFRNMPLILQALFWFAVISHMPGPRQAVRFAGVVVSNRGVNLPFLTPAGLGVAAAGSIGAFAAAWMLRRHRPFQRGRTLIAISSGAPLALAAWAGFFRAEALWSAPELTGFNFSGGVHVPTELISILAALSLFGSAYIAEIVRGGFETVPKGVIEAARALALPAWALEAKVRVPLALRAIILPLGSQYTTLIKATSIGLAIGFTDLFAVTLMSINQSGRTISLLCVMTACFVLLNQAVVSAANALNHAFQIPGTSGT